MCWYYYVMKALLQCMCGMWVLLCPCECMYVHIYLPHPPPPPQPIPPTNTHMHTSLHMRNRMQEIKATWRRSILSEKKLQIMLIFKLLWCFRRSKVQEMGPIHWRILESKDMATYCTHSWPQWLMVFSTNENCYHWYCTVAQRTWHSDKAWLPSLSVY